LINQRTLFDSEIDSIEQIFKIHEQPQAALKAGWRISDLTREPDEGRVQAVSVV
jgi:hypothetical protein